MKEISAVIKAGKTKHILRALFDGKEIFNIHFDGSVLEVPKEKENETQDERKTRKHAEKDFEHYSKILANQMRIEDEKAI